MKASELKNQLRSTRDSIPKSHAVRLHRAISWLEAAEQQSETDDDMCFISLWIAFNSCYAVEESTEDTSERQRFRDFSGALCELDPGNQIHDCLWLNYSKFVRLLIDNQYLYAPFWRVQQRGEGDWQRPFDSNKHMAMRAVADGKTPILLSIVLDRLYVLRNQLLHGGATYGSSVNRAQVVDGKRMLLELMPIVISIMLESDDRDWGEIPYPVIE